VSHPLFAIDRESVDKQGKTVDFLLTAKRDMAAAKRFRRPWEANGDPEKVAIDKSRANKAAIDAINAGAPCRSWCANSNILTT
jgi:transposase-like protein